MIKIENTEVVGWEHAIRGMRNPKNSWDRMDSEYKCPYSGNGEKTCSSCTENMCIGPNDHKLMMQLANGGPVHAKYRRMITVYVDITAPLYWWKEFDTYKVGTVANSCSTMHKLTYKEFELGDFSHDKLLPEALSSLNRTIKDLNYWRDVYFTAKKMENPKPTEKQIWEQMIQLLPSSYNQKRTIMLNYEVLVGMYHDRKNHKLDEWHEFCDWIKELPYSEIITGPKFIEKVMNLPEKDKE